MPKAFQYKTGALIYFQGDPAEKVYIVQNGKVSLVYQDIETGEDVRDQVTPGEFFGVKSALGRFPREENAIALADTTILAFTVPEFETLAMANTRIIMKMLKVFSNHMRRIHAQVASLMEKENVKPDAGLFDVGEYYLKNKRYSQAKYVFGRYLTYYPSGSCAAQAAKNLEAAESYLAQYGEGKGPPPGSVPAAAAAPAKTEDQSGAARAYYDAVSLISQEKYQQAYQDFKKIADTQDNTEWAAKSLYEMGRCLYFLEKFEESIKFYTVMLTQYPRHPDIRDTMFYIGQANEHLGKKEQAAAFYKKILSMPAGEDDGTTVKTKRALKAMEG
ncbi:MAG: cyclic nucleotide-binding domain-containing protein [Treponema sp.]|jgi:CRP-like cAMP-binding protein|nr:cyclic nucleotide-binding domain-containing protein [Treponema sp.]